MMPFVDNIVNINYNIYNIRQFVAFCVYQKRGDNMINDFYRNYFSATINSNLNGLQYAISSKRGTYTFSNCSAEDMEKVMSILPYEYPMTYSVFLNETNGLSNGLSIWIAAYLCFGCSLISKPSGVRLSGRIQAAV